MEERLNGTYLDGKFIEKYISCENKTFIVVYIFLKSCNEPSVHGTAKALNLNIMEVYSAIEFWKNEGLIEEKDGNISFIIHKKTMTFGERPEYEIMELNMYANKNSDVKELFEIAGRYLGRMLTHNDLSSVFAIYNWLGLSISVIEKLLEYCTENGHRNMRYIERVALDWAENNVSTASEAEEKIKLYNVDFRRIMRAMGQSNRNPIAAEEKYMTTWIKDMKMPLEVIELACEKTVTNTGKASFSYANKILTSWKAEDVRNCEEAYGLESKFKENKKKEDKEIKDKQAIKQAPQRKNKFVNFEQRTYDFDEYERREFERISKKEL